ncbi:unnamed protein product [Acanthoscelides obtectus]|uniref:Uncharacterized protein n=1 Tax=Acanthoscelides obtectus TaxID=200917 RepID=A0A9P0K863_ACAOB|nr:unnamed protein product [Acanthoscelides obtectus]CAK1671982.1 hypothetical protein AOBTE_LOCUS28589 [Acanthoscelides obtectus]
MIALCLFSFLLVGALGYPAPQDDALLDSNNDVIPQGDAASLIPEGDAEGAGLAPEQPEPETEIALESAPAPQAELGPELAAGKEEPSGFAAPSSRRKPTKADDDDSASDSFPFGISGAAGRGASAYNIFFPIQFSGARGRSGAGGSAYSAIANSFSTGRKGIATSHATSIGDPALAAEFFNLRKQGKTEA